MQSDTQLDLFSWDTNLLGVGYDALANLEFLAAERSFQKVLGEQNDHPGAQNGLQHCKYWKSILKKKAQLNGIEACEFLWQEITKYSFEDPLSSSLKKTLLQKLLDDLNGIDPNLFTPTGLCLGQILFQLNNQQEAIDHFENLLDLYAKDPLFLVNFANILSLTKNSIRAKLYLIQALFIAPAYVSTLTIMDHEIKQLIDHEGSFAASIYGWLQCGMPHFKLPEIEEVDLEHIAAMRTYEMIQYTESLRIQGQYEKMIEARKELKKQDPNIFEAYMAQIK